MQPSRPKSLRAFIAAAAAIIAIIAIAACAGPQTAPPPTLAPPEQNATEPESCPSDGYCALFQIGGRLLAAAWLDQDRMYISDWDGDIRLLNINTGDIATVAQDLNYPQGLTVLDGRLYASDMGNACDLALEYGNHDCKWPEPFDQELELLSRIDSRILSFAIGADGRLSDPQTVVGRLISRDIEHSPNGLTNDGEYVYASVGSILWSSTGSHRYPKIDRDLGDRAPRMDLSGKIIRFRPPNGEIEIYASGFRNTYGISVAPDGALYGADNGGVWAREELNAIVKGGFYGFPVWTPGQDAPSENPIGPVAELTGKVGSTFAHANQDGVYVASQMLDELGNPTSHFAVDRYDYDTWTPQRIFNANAFATAALERNGLLYITLLSGGVHVINPNSDALPIDDNSKEIRYVDRVVSNPDAYRIRQGTPGYDLYIESGKLIYNKTQCSAEDAAQRFFLHISPDSREDLTEERREHGFDNLDFWLTDHGWRVGDRCLAIIDLPEYPIAEIDTGQIVESDGRYSRVWQAKHSP